MELILARNCLLPQLDVGAFYRWLGVGDDLIHADPNGIRFPSDGFRCAWSELTGGKFQEWGFLLPYNMPVGFRRRIGRRASRPVATGARKGVPGRHGARRVARPGASPSATWTRTSNFRRQMPTAGLLRRRKSKRWKPSIAAAVWL